jgi:hypothetical protein
VNSSASDWPQAEHAIGARIDDVCELLDASTSGRCVFVV